MRGWAQDWVQDVQLLWLVREVLVREWTNGKKAYKNELEVSISMVSYLEGEWGSLWLIIISWSIMNWNLAVPK